MPRVSVVIPNWNGAKHLEECFDALAKQSFSDFETIFVDNASADASVEWVRTNSPATRMICRPDNGGFSNAVNAGILASSAEYVALLNNDTAVEEHWLEELVRALDERRDYDLAAPLMMLYYEDDLVNAAGDAFSILHLYGYNRGYLEPSATHLHPQRVLGACAGAALYRRTLFDAIGLFDEDFFLGSEDTDINLRALIAGKRCLYVPKAVVRHKFGASTSEQPAPRMLRLAERNQWIVVAKDMPWPILLSAPLLWVYLSLRGTFPLRPSKWHLVPGLIRRVPERIRNTTEGLAIGWSKRRQVWSKREASTLTILRWLWSGAGEP